MGPWVLGYFVILPAWVDGSILTAKDAKQRLGLMPAALARIYRIFQNFAWVASALGNHRIH